MSLKLVDSRQPWNQQEGEPEEKFNLFLKWLVAHPRPRPYFDFATEWNWARRAKSFDQQTSLPAHGEEQRAEVSRLMQQIVLLDMRKHHKFGLAGDAPEHSLKTLILMQQFLNEGGITAEQQDQLENLSEEQIDNLHEIIEALG